MHDKVSIGALLVGFGLITSCVATQQKSMAQDLHLPYTINPSTAWYTTPGQWTVPLVIKLGPLWEQCLRGPKCTSFMVHVWHQTCLRYLEPKVLRDGREIPSHITESGKPGDTDWTFETDELFTGQFIWEVTTVDICPKVG